MLNTGNWYAHLLSHNNITLHLSHFRLRVFSVTSASFQLICSSDFDVILTLLFPSCCFFTSALPRSSLYASLRLFTFATLRQLFHLDFPHLHVRFFTSASSRLLLHVLDCFFTSAPIHRLLLARSGQIISACPPPHLPPYFLLVLRRVQHVLPSLSLRSLHCYASLKQSGKSKRQTDLIPGTKDLVSD